VQSAREVHIALADTNDVIVTVHTLERSGVNERRERVPQIRRNPH
jgi:hypothetical protein